MSNRSNGADAVPDQGGMPAIVSVTEISDSDALPAHPLLSVCMLAYNHEKYIANAIDGVVAQRCDFPIELIIGEDCSPDRTREIAVDYQRRFPHLIRIVTSDQNVGMKANELRCTNAARGSYLAICEGDDFWTDPLKLSTQVELLQCNPDVSLCCHAAIWLDEQTGAIISHHPARASRALGMQEIILGDGDFIDTCSIVARRAIFKSEPSWSREAPIGDYPLLLRAAQHGKVAYIDRSMATYRRNAPASWSVAHRGFATESDKALAYARAINSMFAGFNSDTNQQYARAVARMTSKYFYRYLVNATGSRREKLARLSSARDSIIKRDFALAFFAIVSNRKLNRIRNWLAHVG